MRPATSVTLCQADGLRYTLTPTHISDIRPGDTILLNGNLRTVCASNIGRDELLGRTLFGDSYNSGSRLVQRADIFRALPKLAR